MDDSKYVRVIERILALNEGRVEPARTVREINNVLLVRRVGGMYPPTEDERRFPRLRAA
jgi:hypothetical protein